MAAAPMPEAWAPPDHRPVAGPSESEAHQPSDTDLAFDAEPRRVTRGPPPLLATSRTICVAGTTKRPDQTEVPCYLAIAKPNMRGTPKPKSNAAGDRPALLVHLGVSRRPRAQSVRSRVPSRGSNVNGRPLHRLEP